MGAVLEDKSFYKRELNWIYVLFHIHLNILAACGLLYVFTEAKLLTTLFSLSLVLLGVLGVTAGSHRLWAHRSYTASTRLKIFLMICQTLTGQGTIYDWVLQHRLHHKHFGTDLDPFNPTKGLLYAQYLSLMLKQSPALVKAESEIDMVDIEADEIVMFQKKYYWLLYPIVFLLLPINAPAEYWGESIALSVFVVGFARYAIVLNMSWLIHSATRIWGLQPGEKYPCDTNLVFILTKNYWLQYHYLTPWDYQTCEYGKYGTDCTSKFIRICAAIGDATDLRTVDSESVKAALEMTVETKRPVSECLLEIEQKGLVPKEHYLKPTKYF